MKKIVMALLCAVLLCGTAVTVLAQPPPPGGRHYEDWRGDIRSRIHAAEERIERGIEHGSLTRHEARGLQGELHGIRDKIDRMRDDGHLDPRERDIIQRDLSRLERHISQEKRDDERQHHQDGPPSWPPRPY
ncbi:MAG: hypothetical protein BWK76_03445 [Desulfobulbaceae bacterium A2]|nr:MAG: hypothetical protein BWK76_03445 [Desulfobulbaceae bacterium A2]